MMDILQSPAATSGMERNCEIGNDALYQRRCKMGELSHQFQLTILHDAFQLKQCYKIEQDDGFPVVLGMFCSANNDDGGIATLKMEGIFRSTDDIEVVKPLEAGIKNFADSGKISERLVLGDDSNQ